MDQAFYVANIYLKVLARSNPALLSVVQDNIGSELTASLLEQEFLYDSQIELIFNTFAEQGVDSWLLRYGKNLSIASHGPLGFAVLSAPNLQTAMQALSDYTVLRTSAYRFEFHQNRNRAEFLLIDQTGGARAGQWIIETGVRIAQQLLENVLAHSLGDNAVISFTYAEPDYAHELEQFYGVNCQFNAKQNSISFPASWCQISSPLSDNETFKSNLAKCQEFKLAQSGLEELDKLIALELANYFEQRTKGQASRSELPSLASLAERHHLSTRTLNRKLKSCNSSYKSLLEDARRSQAEDLLKNTHLKVADIAYNLAYLEPANFIRAFKSWHNVTPAAWRRQHTN